MQTISTSAAPTAPLYLLRADRIRRKVVASDAVASLLADMIYGSAGRGDVALLAGVTADRVSACHGARL